MKIDKPKQQNYERAMEFDDLTEAEKLFFKASEANIDRNVSPEERKALWDQFSQAAERELDSGEGHDAS